MTEQQNRLYQWLLARRDNPIGPTFEEMRIAMGLASKAGVARLIGELEQRGRVTRIANRSHSVRAVVADTFHGVSTDALVDELKRRGAWPL